MELIEADCAQNARRASTLNSDEFKIFKPIKDYLQENVYIEKPG